MLEDGDGNDTLMHTRNTEGQGSGPIINPNSGTFKEALNEVNQNIKLHSLNKTVPVMGEKKNNSMDVRVTAHNSKMSSIMGNQHETNPNKNGAKSSSEESGK